MQHLSIRFLIGLAVDEDRPYLYTEKSNWVGYNERTARALGILSANYPGLTSWRGTGYWQGKPEPSLIVEAVVDVDEGTVDASGFQWAPTGPTAEDRIGRAQSLAGEVARALNQSAVALVVQPVRFSLEGPHATEG